MTVTAIIRITLFIRIFSLLVFYGRPYQGKENLNFDQWGDYGNHKQKNKLDRIVKQIKSDQMPLTSYTFIHRNAILSDNQKQQVIKWIQNNWQPCGRLLKRVKK